MRGSESEGSPPVKGRSEPSSWPLKTCLYNTVLTSPLLFFFPATSCSYINPWLPQVFSKDWIRMNRERDCCCWLQNIEIVQWGNSKNTGFVSIFTSKVVIPLRNTVRHNVTEVDWWKCRNIFNLEEIFKFPRICTQIYFITDVLWFSALKVKHLARLTRVNWVSGLS